MDEHFAAPNDAACPHEIEATPHPLGNLGAALADASPQARAAAITRSRRLPDPSLMQAAWHTLPGRLQDQIGTAALTHSFYSLVPEVPGRELTLQASWRCESLASEALTSVDGIAKAALPALYGTEEQEPEWALSDTPMAFYDPLDAYGPTVMAPEVAAAAAIRSDRIPGLDDLLQAWTRLPPAVQDQLGTQAIATAFYGWLAEDGEQDPADRWLTDHDAGECNDYADQALNLIARIAEHSLPSLYGTKQQQQEPEWACVDGGHHTDTVTPTPISLAITLHHRAWQTLQASNDFLTATGKADRKNLVWPAADAEDEALTDLLMLSVRSRQDAAEIVAHLCWYLGVGSQHPRRPSPVEADGALITARLADLGMVLGEAVPEAAPRLAPGEFGGLLVQCRAAWSAYSEAAKAVLPDGWDALAPLSSAAHAAAEAVLRARAVTARMPRLWWPMPDGTPPSWRRTARTWEMAWSTAPGGSRLGRETWRCSYCMGMAGQFRRRRLGTAQAQTRRKAAMANAEDTGRKGPPTDITCVQIPGFSVRLPSALAAAFADRITIGAPELCRLLPIDSDTLRGHIKRGHIDYVQTGLGDRSPRKAFTLDAVLRFLEDRSCRECPSTSQRSPRSTPTTSGGAVSDIRARLERRTAEKLRQRAEGLSGAKS